MDGADIGQSDEKVNVPLPEDGEPWPHSHMKLFRTKPDEVRDPSDIKCPGYTNENTAWWDGSQIYGSSEKATQALRTKLPDGKLTLDEIGTVSFLPRDNDGTPLTGFHDNWWIGMEMLHTLFALEHNAICDALMSAYPHMTGSAPSKSRQFACADRSSGTNSLTKPGSSTAH